jgi:N-acetylglucosaminyldiphosphoundecaprenol N-acetyl-beta-D-mannosaminyltransferase
MAEQGHRGAAAPPEAAHPAAGRATLMGVRLDLVTEDEAIARVIGGLDEGRGGWAMSLNLDILRKAVTERSVTGRSVASLAADADLVLADGMPVIWALRGLGIPDGVRVAGSTMLGTLSAAAARAGRSVFLLGGAPGVAERAADVLTAANPGLVVAGTNCPPLGFEHDEAELAAIVEALKEARPDIVYCGFGCPKQERLIVHLREVLPEPWYLAVGAGIAMAAGDFARAPRWMQRTGLEWLYRLLLEPRRLFRRYVLEDLPFVPRLAGHVAAERWRRARRRQA